MVTRNSSSTQSKILAAATEAFVAMGPAGARVDAIAAAAGVNKRMLYHHFGDKQGLYQAVLAASKEQLGPLSSQSARLLAWEGLLQPSLIASQAKLPPLGAAIEPLAEPQPENRTKDSVDPAMLELLQLALQVFPHVCGAEVKRLTGMAPESEAFAAALGHLKDQLDERMASGPVAPTTKAKVTLRARTTARGSSPNA